MSKPTTYFWKICKKSHGKRVIVSLVSNESLFFACHVSLLFNTQGSFVSKLQPIKTSQFWQGAWGRIGISEGFYFWAHEGASDVNGLTIIILRKGSPHRGVCGMYMEWYLTIIVLRKGFSHRDVCGMYMEWYLTIICLRLSECCRIILRQSWGDYSPIFTSAPVLLNGKHNFWQGIGTLVISYNNNNFFFVYLVSHPRIL